MQEGVVREKERPRVRAEESGPRAAGRGEAEMGRLV